MRHPSPAARTIRNTPAPTSERVARAIGAVVHMPRNDAAAPGHVCPGIRIHAIDIVQPPGIGISPIADMDAHHSVVRAALAAKSSAATQKKDCWEARLRSALVVLVMAAPPDSRLVAALGGAVEPLVHAPDAVHPA